MSKLLDRLESMLDEMEAANKPAGPTDDEVRAAFAVLQQRYGADLQTDEGDAEEAEEEGTERDQALMARIDALEARMGDAETEEAEGDEEATTAQDGEEEVSEREAALLARIEALEGGNAEASTDTETNPTQRVANRQVRTAQRRESGRRVGTPDISKMTIEERAQYYDEVVAPADKAGRPVV